MTAEEEKRAEEIKTLKKELYASNIDDYGFTKSEEEAFYKGIELALWYISKKKILDEQGVRIIKGDEVNSFLVAIQRLLTEKQRKKLAHIVIKKLPTHPNEKIKIIRGRPGHQHYYKLGHYIIPTGGKSKGNALKIIGHSRYDHNSILCEDSNGYTYNDEKMLLSDIIQGRNLLDNGFDVLIDKVCFYRIPNEVE